MSRSGRRAFRALSKRGVTKHRLVSAITLVFVFATAVPARAGDSEVEWYVSGCDEVAAVYPSDLTQGEALVVLAYRCDHAVVDGEPFEDIVVSEISVMRSGGSTLLRQVTNNETLHARLRSLGVADSYMGKIDFEEATATTAPRVEVTFGRVRYSLEGLSLSNPLDPTPTIGGASYRYAGRRGTVTFRYVNHQQSFTPSLFEIDAAKDDALRRWMGTSTGTAPGIVAAGAWTGTASLAP